MSPVLSSVRCRFALVVLGLAGTLVPALAPAQDIQVKLNLMYQNPLDDDSGGQWELIAKTSEGNFGLEFLEVYLSGVEVPSSAPLGPRGTVNGSDPAGFSLMAPFTDPQAPGAVGIVIGQIPAINPQTEQSIFYGVGRLPNGQPGDIGPALTTLTGPQAIPWGGDDFFLDPAWENGVLLARGSFLPGMTPDFYSQGQFFTRGSVYTSLPPNAMLVGGTSGVAATANFVEDNLGASPDYNGDGKVDGGDYVLWRNTLGNMAGQDLRADGNGNGQIDLGDYQVWKDNYGMMFPVGPGSGGLAVPDPGLAGGSAGSTVPEPASIVLLAGASAMLFLRPKTLVLRRVNES